MARLRFGDGRNLGFGVDCRGRRFGLVGDIGHQNAQPSGDAIGGGQGGGRLGVSGVGDRRYRPGLELRPHKRAGRLGEAPWRR
jgi:hypothetical protein